MVLGAGRALTLLSVLLSVLGLTGDSSALVWSERAAGRVLCGCKARICIRTGSLSQGAHLALRGGGKQDEGAGRRTQHNRGKATANEPDLELEVPILLRVNATVVELVEALGQIAGRVEGGPDGEDVLTWNGNGNAAGKAGDPAGGNERFRAREAASKSFRARHTARVSLWWGEQLAARADLALSAALEVEDAARIMWLLQPTIKSSAEMLEYSALRLERTLEALDGGLAEVRVCEPELDMLATAAGAERAATVQTCLCSLEQLLVELRGALVTLQGRAAEAEALEACGGAAAAPAGGGAANASAESSTEYELSCESDSRTRYSSASCFEALRAHGSSGHENDRILWGGEMRSTVDAQGRTVPPDIAAFDETTSSSSSEEAAEDGAGERGVRALVESVARTHGAHIPYLPPRAVLGRLAARLNAPPAPPPPALGASAPNATAAPGVWWRDDVNGSKGYRGGWASPLRPFPERSPAEPSAAPAAPGQFAGPSPDPPPEVRSAPGSQAVSAHGEPPQGAPLSPRPLGLSDCAAPAGSDAGAAGGLAGAVDEWLEGSEGGEAQSDHLSELFLEPAGETGARPASHPTAASIRTV